MTLQRLVMLGPLLVLVSGGCGTRGQGWELIAAGHPRRALELIRPDGPGAFLLRARALGHLGEWALARDEARLALRGDPRSADAQLLLGIAEWHLGDRGAAFDALSRAHELRPEQVCLRRWVGRLHLTRAALMLEPRYGICQAAAARREVVAALQADPCLARRAQPYLARVEALARGESAGRAPPLRPLAPVACSGIPRLRAERRIAPGPCRLSDPYGLVRRLRARPLVRACSAAHVAIRLERAGCLQQAAAAWGVLRAELPEDPRWPLELARVRLAQGRLGQAKIHLLDHVFLARDRAAAHLAAARALILAGHVREGGRRAVASLPFADRLDQYVEAVELLWAAGCREQARQVAEMARKRRWGAPAGRVDARLERALGGSS